MRIEMIVFSGRRNPSWGLPLNEVQSLQTVIRKLSRVSGPLGIPESLGYCGMVVSNDEPSPPWTSLVVYHEYVVAHFRNRIDYLIDADRLLENWLLETAKNHVTEDVIESIRAEQEATGTN